MKSPKCNNLILTNGLVGVFINQLPDDQLKSFNTWLFGQTVARVEGQEFAYAQDYDRWYASWIKDEVAEIID